MRSTTHSRIIVPLLAAALFLVLFHIFLQYNLITESAITRFRLGELDADLTYWFDLNGENTVGAVFSTFLLACAGLTMLYCAVNSETVTSRKAGWYLFAIVLFYMAADEYFQLHERSRGLFGIEASFGENVIPGWVRVMAIMVPLVCIPLTYYWWRLPKVLRLRLAIAAAIFLFGAVGLEISSSLYVMNNGQTTFRHAVLVALEEGLEMLGVLLVIDAMLFHIAQTKVEPQRANTPKDT